MEYERLDRLVFNGKGLDVGGGAQARYLKHLHGDYELDSVNIDSKMEPTYLLKPGDKFPARDKSYDFVISLNTLEHIFDPTFVINEVFRVLKDGGIAFIVVPFIFRIHAHPDDFFRATPSWWFESFSRAGFTGAEIYPLVWGRSITGGSVSGYSGILPKQIRLHSSALFDIIYARLRSSSTKGSDEQFVKRVWAVSQGWFMEVFKNGDV